MIELIEFFALIITIVGLFIWNRSESRSDIRHMDARLDTNIKHMDSKLEIYVGSIREEVRAIQQEIKDFHGRLCAIEDRRHQK